MRAADYGTLAGLCILAGAIVGVLLGWAPL
jgi:hypothetical protein